MIDPIFSINTSGVGQWSSIRRQTLVGHHERGDTGERVARELPIH
jgi:hypothetical protein